MPKYLAPHINHKSMTATILTSANLVWLLINAKRRSKRPASKLITFLANGVSRWMARLIYTKRSNTTGWYPC